MLVGTRFEPLGGRNTGDRSVKVRDACSVHWRSIGRKARFFIVFISEARAIGGIEARVNLGTVFLGSGLLHSVNKIKLYSV